MSANPTAAAAPAEPVTCPWSPFRHAPFTLLWTATLVSSIGGWMYSAASGWLMMSLNPDPFVVSMVQVAATLPLFFFALPAGALADIVDRRKLLIGVQIAMAAVSAMFAAIVSLGLATPANLLLFTFLIGVGGALTAPAWQAIVPQLVPKQAIPPAVAANSVGFNVSRAVGPALGGVIISKLGIAAPFWLNAISNLGIIATLLWWQPPPDATRRPPAERFGSAIRTGFRHARNNPPLRATLIRGAAILLFASAYWALLPLVAGEQMGMGPDLYSLLLGAIGVGAVGGAFALPWLQTKLGPDRLVAAGSIGTAVAMVLFGLARDSATALSASVIAGACWIAILSSLNVSAQVAQPEWVRARGLAVYLTVFYGTLALGSAVWGQVAGMFGLSAAQFMAAAGALVAIPLTWRWKLQTAAGVDLTPSMHGDPTGSRTFLVALAKLARERRRDGAYRWGVFEGAAADGRLVETFLVESWLEHLHQHERVTNEDRMLQDAVHRFHTEGTHLTRA
jgi:MFS family permease